MPEAVDSNSIAMPEGQPDEIIISTVDRVITVKIENRAKVCVSACGSIVIWPELFGRVAEIMRNIYADAGLVVPPDQELGGPVSRYYNALIRQLNGSRDPIEAGSFLPWLEQTMRRDRDFVSIEPEKEAPPKSVSVRDQIISDKYREGMTAEQLSQAFNIKRVKIERVIARLNAVDGNHRQVG